MHVSLQTRHDVFDSIDNVHTGSSSDLLCDDVWHAWYYMNDVPHMHDAMMFCTRMHVHAGLVCARIKRARRK